MAVVGGGVAVTNIGGAQLVKNSRLVASSTYNLITCGDSLSVYTGTVTTPYVNVLAASLLSNRTITATTKPFGVGGMSWAYNNGTSNSFATSVGLNTLTPSQVLSELDPTQTNIVIGFAGSNGIFLGGNSAATEFAAFQTWRAMILASGLPANNLIVVTLLPRQDDATFNGTTRVSYNSSVKADAVSFGYQIADAAANVNIGVTGQEDSLTYYQSDKIHLNNTGQSTLAGIIYPLIP